MNSEETPQKARGRKKGSKKIWIVILIILLLLSAGGAYYYFVMRQQPTGNLDEEARNYAPNASVGALPGKTEEEIKEMLNQQVSEKMIAFSINSTMIFENGSSVGEMKLECPANNINNIEFVIRREDTDEVLYKSGMLVPNQYILEDKLQTKTPLPKGEYPCVADIHLIDAKTMEDKGFVQASVTIKVKN